MRPSPANRRRNETRRLLLSALFVPLRSCGRYFHRRGTKSAERKGIKDWAAACEQLGLLQGSPAKPPPERRATGPRSQRFRKRSEVGNFGAGCQFGAAAGHRPALREGSQHPGQQ